MVRTSRVTPLNRRWFCRIHCGLLPLACLMRAPHDREGEWTHHWEGYIYAHRNQVGVSTTKLTHDSYMFSIVVKSHFDVLCTPHLYISLLPNTHNCLTALVPLSSQQQHQPASRVPLPLPPRPSLLAVTPPYSRFALQTSSGEVSYW